MENFTTKGMIADWASSARKASLAMDAARLQRLDDGDVDMEIQGEETACQRAIQEIYQNKSRWIRIDDYFVKERAVDPEERRFRSIY
mgnify:CR=1 FL=1